MEKRLDPKAVGNNWNGNGQENAEGSDGSGNELDEMEVGGGNYGKWDTVRNKTRKKKRKNKSDESDSDRGLTVEETEREEYLVFVKLEHEGDSFGDMNPIQLTKTLNKEIGVIKSAKILRNGSLLIICMDEKQQMKVIRMNKINGKKVQCSKTNGKKIVKGVITGIPVNVSVEDVKGNIKNANVNEVRRLKINRNGSTYDSLSIMITFDEEKLPNKIYI